MAKVVDNLVMQGLSGRLGKQLVIRRRRDGSFVVAAAPPRNTGRVPTEGQRAYRQRFAAAIAHAKSVKDDASVIAAAREKGQTPFNFAVAEYLAKHK